MTARVLGHDVVVPGVRVVLPATSANLGPGFDAVGLALSMHLRVDARPAAAFGIEATGRNTDLVGAAERNLILETYADVLRQHGRAVQALRLSIHNEIPLGMGCGSSAAALLAGVALADRFGDLGMGDAGIVAEASRREGHPDNVAACWYGGMTVSADTGAGVETATFAGSPWWQMLLVLPAGSLATKESRALLPASYSRADAVFNVQRASLLVAAFAQGRLELLRAATEDRVHQPYRAEACALLPKLLPLAAGPEFAAVTLSGAGPSVLLFLNEGVGLMAAEARLADVVGDGVEVLPVRVAEGARVEVLEG